jgi:hypothetical protein
VHRINSLARLVRKNWHFLTDVAKLIDFQHSPMWTKWRIIL